MYNAMYILKDLEVPQMIRKQIYIEPQQEKRLKQLSREQGVTEAELIRQAIDQAQASETNLGNVLLSTEAWEREKVFIRKLMAKGCVTGGRRWRREELYEDC